MFFLMPIFFWCLRRPWSRQCGSGSSTPCWKVKDVDEHLISRVPRFDVAGQVICPQNLKLKVLSVDAGVNAFPHDQFLVLWFFQMHSRQRLDEPSRAWPEIRRGAVTECKQQKPRSDIRLLNASKASCSFWTLNRNASMPSWESGCPAPSILTSLMRR